MTNKEPTIAEQIAFMEMLANDFVIGGPKLRAILSTLQRYAEMEDQLRSMTRQRDEWHGRAAEAVKLRRERDETARAFTAATRELAKLKAEGGSKLKSMGGTCWIDDEDGVVWQIDMAKGTAERMP